MFNLPCFTFVYEFINYCIDISFVKSKFAVLTDKVFGEIGLPYLSDVPKKVNHKGVPYFDHWDVKIMGLSVI